MAKKVDKFVINAQDKPEVKAHKNDIINALITWHDKPDKKDNDGNLFNYADYEETIKIALQTLLLSGDINQTQVQEIIAYLSDDKFKLKGDINLLQGTKGIVTEDLNPFKPPEPKVSPHPRPQ